MPLAYAFKHVFRSWKLFLALLIGIMLASTFFGGIDIKANATAQQAIDQQLSSIAVDMRADIPTSDTAKMLEAQWKVLNLERVEDAEIISSAWMAIELPGEEWSHEVRLVGITNNSHVYDGWLNKPDEIGENETYILEGSRLADKYANGDFNQLNFSMQINDTNQFSLNLKVKGLAQLDDKAYSIASGYSWATFPMEPVEFSKTGEGLLLVSWEKTVKTILDAGQETTQPVGFEDTRILIYLDRDALITPWDIESSIDNIKTLEYEIENELADLGVRSVQNNLEYSLIMFRYTSTIIRFRFTLVSLPIFFMAWYMGTTVSNVSFNLRRREIGLLLTKGFSRGQILGIFLTETLLVGLIGGLLGVLFGFLLNPLFTQFSPEALFNLQAISPYTMVFTVAFGVIIAFLSTFSSARKASQLQTVDALREYLPIEEEKPYRKRWPWVAFILGTYKIIVFILGVDMTTKLTRVAWSGNFILILLVGIFIIIDMVLYYIGPLLFFWGFTKLFIQSSLKFQELTARAAKFVGDLGALATKNVRRNPARSAAIAFLIALIVGYGVQVTGQLASEQDYAVRETYYQVGADVAVEVADANEAPEILDAIMANVSEHLQNVTIEYSFFAYLPAGTGITVKAVEPQSWLKTAYYESGWFSGRDVVSAFNYLTADKNAIVLERSVAKLLNRKIGDSIALNFGNSVKTLKIVGFIGVEPADQLVIVHPAMECWSFVSNELYEEVRSYQSPYARISTRILLKLKGSANGESIAENVRDLGLDISYVESFAEEWEEAQADVMVMGMLDVQRLGIVFAVLAASVGTALVSAVSMKERTREATIMSVKGLSYKQLVIMFLTENLALTVFSVTLGFVVGLIVVYGNISAANVSIQFLVQRRLIFPLDTTLMLVSCVALIFVSTILPIIIISRKYVTKLERMVRLR